MKKPTHKTTYPHHMHTDMQRWANHLSKPVLSVSVEFYDGSRYTDTFPRATKEVRYKVDGEVYTVDIDTSKFRADWLPECDEPIGATKLKKAFMEWITRSAADNVKSITWAYEKA